MENRSNMSTNTEDIIEQWLNEPDSEEDEIYRNSPTSRNYGTTTHSDTEFSDNEKEFVITSDHDSNSELSESEDQDEEVDLHTTTVHLCPKCRLPI